MAVVAQELIEGSSVIASISLKGGSRQIEGPVMIEGSAGIVGWQ